MNKVKIKNILCLGKHIKNCIIMRTDSIQFPSLVQSVHYNLFIGSRLQRKPLDIYKLLLEKI